MPQPALVGAPGVEAAGWSANRTLPLGIGDRRGDCGGDCLGNLILDREDIGEIAVVPFGPNVVAALCLDQLACNPDAVARFAQAAFEHIANSQLAPNLLHVHRAALV